MQRAQQDKPRKSYKKPTLKVYGDVTAQTATVSNTAMFDFGSGGMSRTH